MAHRVQKDEYSCHDDYSILSYQECLQKVLGFSVEITEFVFNGYA